MKFCRMHQRADDGNIGFFRAILDSIEQYQEGSSSRSIGCLLVQIEIGDAIRQAVICLVISVLRIFGVGYHCVRRLKWDGFSHTDEQLRKIDPTIWNFLISDTYGTSCTFSYNTLSQIFNFVSCFCKIKRGKRTLSYNTNKSSASLLTFANNIPIRFKIQREKDIFYHFYLLIAILIKSILLYNTQLPLFTNCSTIYNLLLYINSYKNGNKSEFIAVSAIIYY